MICTGCCATLDNIITYLFKRLTRKQTKPVANQLPDSEAFLRIHELHPEILQQVRSCVNDSKADVEPVANTVSLIVITITVINVIIVIRRLVKGCAIV